MSLESKPSAVISGGATARAVTPLTGVSLPPTDKK
jgi:hypothetical protein